MFSSYLIGLVCRREGKEYTAALRDGLAVGVAYDNREHEVGGLGLESLFIAESDGDYLGRYVLSCGNCEHGVDNRGTFEECVFGVVGLVVFVDKRRINAYFNREVAWRGLCKAHGLKCQRIVDVDKEFTVGLVFQSGECGIGLI